MRGEELGEAELWWHGLEGDRKYAFLRRGNTSGHPWLTGRQIPEMITFQPYFERPEEPRDSPVRVITPDGQDLPLESDALRDELAARFKAPVDLTKMGRGALDSMPLSLISVETLGALGAEAGMTLEPRRFRPNLLLEGVEGAFAEEQWLGGLLQFGEREDSARVRVYRRNERCMMINLDPASARQNPTVLRTVSHWRDALVGVYASTDRPGTIRAGDRLWWVEP